MGLNLFITRDSTAGNRRRFTTTHVCTLFKGSKKNLCLINFVNRMNSYWNVNNGDVCGATHIVYSWVSSDVIIPLGVNSKSMYSYRREIVFHCMCCLELGSKYVQFGEIFSLQYSIINTFWVDPHSD